MPSRPSCKLSAHPCSVEETNMITRDHSVGINTIHPSPTPYCTYWITKQLAIQPQNLENGCSSKLVIVVLPFFNNVC